MRTRSTSSRALGTRCEAEIELIDLRSQPSSAKTLDMRFFARWAIPKGSLHSAFSWLLACLLPLLWTLCATASEKASADAIRRASELIVRGDLSGAEKEANLALSSPSTQPLAYAALGAIRLKQKKYAESDGFCKGNQAEP